MKYLGKEVNQKNCELQLILYPHQDYSSEEEDEFDDGVFDNDASFYSDYCDFQDEINQIIKYLGLTLIAKVDLESLDCTININIVNFKFDDNSVKELQSLYEAIENEFTPQELIVSIQLTTATAIDENLYKLDTFYNSNNHMDSPYSHYDNSYIFEDFLENCEF